jgi:hypothetical protein
VFVAALQPVDQGFFESAPTRYSHRWSIARPSSEVWAELVGDRPLHWCRGLTVTWTSPRPFSVETTRQAKILGVLKVREYFFAWEEGRRYTFYATEANLPLFHRVAEDYIVEPDGPNRCTFTWKIALAPTLIGKAGGAAYGLLFNSVFKDTTRYFRRLIAAASAASDEPA